MGNKGLQVDLENLEENLKIWGSIGVENGSTERGRLV